MMNTRLANKFLDKTSKKRRIRNIHVIADGEINGITYGCMYDAGHITFDLTKEKDGKTMYGMQIR